MTFQRISHGPKVIVERLLFGEGLQAKLARGAVWLGGGSLVEQASRFARNMILTRLLVPNAFGTMAIIMSCSSLFASLTDVGIRAAVIQNPRGGEDTYLNASWWLTLSRAMFVYAIVFTAAPRISRFYGISDLSPLLRLTMLGSVAEGAMSPRSVLPQRAMKFRRWAAITHGGGICGVVLTIVISFFLRNVWALAIGACAENVFRLLLSYCICPGLPVLRLDRAAAQDLLKFSRGMVGLSLLNLIFARADIFVLGKIYSAEVLGIYAMAVALAQTPSSFLTGVLGQTLLPALSHAQNDLELVNRIVGKIASGIIWLGLPAIAAVCICGKSVLTLIYGGRYTTGAFPLAVAAGVVFLNLLNAVFTVAFFAGGRPALHRRAVAASAIAMLIAIYPASRLLGVVGGQVAALLAITVGYILQLVRMRGLTGLDLLRYGASAVPSVALAAGVVGLCFGAHLLGLTARPLANVIVSVMACVIAYSICVPALLGQRAAIIGRGAK